MNLRERTCTDAAPGTPVPAMKRDCDRAIAQERVETRQAAGLVGEDESRRHFAGLRSARAGTIARYPSHQSVHRVGIGRNELSYGARIGIEPLVEGGIHIATPHECVCESGKLW